MKNISSVCSGFFLSGKAFCFLLAFWGSVTIVHAQKRFTRYDDLPGVIKSYKPSYRNDYPAWAKMLYNEEINFHVIDSLFTQEEGSGLGEQAEKETPIKRYYILWRRAVLRFVQPDGSIRIPPPSSLLPARTPQTAARVAAAASWSFIGPKETYHQQNPYDNPLKNEVPWQVNVYSFDVAATNSNILYAGTETGFVNKTTNKGLTWTLLARNYNFGGGVTAIAIHPANANIVYVAAGGQVHKSSDGGVNWTPLLPPGGTFQADRLRIDPRSPNKIFASAVEGLFLSTDNGATWVKKINAQCYDTEIRTNGSNVVYAITREADASGTVLYRVYLSTNGGTSFSLDPNFNFNEQEQGGALLAVSAANTQLVFLALLGVNNTPKIYKGTYNGTTQRITWSLITTGNSPQLLATNWQGYYDMVFEASPANANVLYFGTSGLHKSTNGGQSFSAIFEYGAGELIPIHPDAQDMKLLNGQQGWIATDGGLTYTTDAFSSAANASARNNGLVGSDFWGFDQGWNEDLVVGGRYHNGNTAVGEFYQDKALRLGGAESPTGHIMHGKSRHAAFNDLGGGHILPPTLTSYEEGRFEFTKYPNEYYYGSRKGGFVIHPNYYNTYYMASDNGVWKSTDGGTSYTLLRDFGAKTWQLQISRKNPNVLYVDVEGQGLYRSGDGGVTWTAKPSLTADPYGFSGWKGMLTFVISPFNENVLYACPQESGIATTRKIFRSTDGGTTWTDWTTTTIGDYGTRQLCIQPLPGNKDGVYLFTQRAYDNSKGGKVFFRAQDMTDWLDYSTNYPVQANLTGSGALPFYRDGKLRACGNMGIWETPLYEPTFPVAALNPSVDKNKGYACARDTFNFDDNSIVRHAGAQWTWSFQPAPAYISDIHARNPKVVFGQTGTYSVTETIVQNGQTYTKTVPAMVDITANICGTVDNFPGKAVSYAGAQSSAMPAFNITSNTLTMSFWVKPTAPSQQEGAGLVLTNGAPKIGFGIKNTNELYYHWDDKYWWINTGLFLVPNQWNHVAMVIAPTSATIYLNGVGTVINEVHDPVKLVSQFKIGQDGDSPDRFFNGQFDEVCFWNRSLTEAEIRQGMHLVKNPASDASLIHYYQFNEPSGTICYDKVGTSHMNLGSGVFVTSTAPVGSGFAKSRTVLTPGTYFFDNTGLEMKFTAGKVPNGDVWVTRLDQPSSNSSSTDKAMLAGSYWIVNNFGTHATEAEVVNLRFSEYNAMPKSNTGGISKLKLFRRGSFEDASASWQQVGMSSEVNAIGSPVAFKVSPMPSVGQFELQLAPSSAEGTRAISLQAEIMDTKNVRLLWEASGETAQDTYVVERSTDGVTFTALDTRKAIPTKDNHTYDFQDANPQHGVLYYRIKRTQNDAVPTYSSVESVEFFNSRLWADAYPNPLRKGEVLTIRTQTQASYLLRIYNLQGAKVYDAPHSGEARLKLSQLKAGTYYYSIIGKTDRQNGVLVIE